MKIRIKMWGGFGKKTKRIKELEQEKEELLNSCNDKCWKLLCDLSDANTEKLKALKEVDDLNKKIEQLKEKAKTEKKELKDKIKELEKQLEESMSNKYIVRKVRATKSKSQTMNIKRSTRQSNAIKLVKEKL